MAIHRFEGKAKDMTAKRLKEPKKLDHSDTPRMADYTEGREPYMYEPHGETTAVERETLSDGSNAYNVIYTQPDGLKLRIGCTNERHAWDFADEIDRVAHVTVLN